MRHVGKHCAAVTGLALALAVPTVSLAIGPSYKQLHAFSKHQGENPNAGVVVDAQGNIYGTTASGGKYRSGTVWRLSSRGVLTTLHEFQGGFDGSIPDSAPILDAQGNLYGTTAQGGGAAAGTVWELTPPAQKHGAWGEAVLHSFAGAPADGSTPQARLLLGTAGVLYGTTAFGGSSNHGTVFSLTPVQGHAPHLRLLYSFAGGTSDGATPVAGLLDDGVGGFYGTTAAGGSGANGGSGTVFHLVPSGKTYTESVLHFFGSGTDGVQPFCQLVADANGTMYGTTSLGGMLNDGTVFSLTPGGTETIIATFNGHNGKQPFAGVVFDAGGRLLGTTFAGGTKAAGTAFALKRHTQKSWIETVLWSFTGPPDGKHPYATLASRPNGSLVGTTYLGGASDMGTVFAVVP